jgi:hypothetical protein
VNAIVDDWGNDVWMRPERDNSAKAVRAPPTGDKTRDLGVFAIGLGIISASLLIFVLFFMPPAPDLSPPKLAVAFSPSLFLVLVGIYVLLSRTTLSVDLAAVIVTIGFVAQALLVMSLVWWIFSAVCVYAIWRTAGQAKQQLRSK